MKKNYVAPRLNSVLFKTEDLLGTSLPNEGYVDGLDTVLDFGSIGGFGG